MPPRSVARQRPSDLYLRLVADEDGSVLLQKQQAEAELLQLKSKSFLPNKLRQGGYQCRRELLLPRHATGPAG